MWSSAALMRSLLSRRLFSGLARLSSLIFRKSRLLLSIGRKIRCFLGVRSVDMIDLDVKKDSSASWDKLSLRKSSVERFGTRTIFSSSDDSVYCTERAGFLGLERVGLVVVEGL